MPQSRSEVRVKKISDAVMEFDQISATPRRILRATKLGNGLLRVEQLAEKPLEFHFLAITVDLGPDPFTLAGARPRSLQGIGMVTKARAFARPSPDSDESEWLALDEITLTEQGAGGIRRAGLPEGETLLV